MCSGSGCSGRPGAEPCSLPGREEKEGGQVSSIPGSLPSREKDRRGGLISSTDLPCTQRFFLQEKPAIVTVLHRDRPQLVFQM